MHQATLASDYVVKSVTACTSNSIIYLHLKGNAIKHISIYKRPYLYAPVKSLAIPVVISRFCFQYTQYVIDKPDIVHYVRFIIVKNLPRNQAANLYP
jgi:hypothetical protein